MKVQEEENQVQELEHLHRETIHLLNRPVALHVVSAEIEHLLVQMREQGLLEGVKASTHLRGVVLLWVCGPLGEKLREAVEALVNPVVRVEVNRVGSGDRIGWYARVRVWLGLQAGRVVLLLLFDRRCFCRGLKRGRMAMLVFVCGRACVRGKGGHPLPKEGEDVDLFDLVMH